MLRDFRGDPAAAGAAALVRTARRPLALASYNAGPATVRRFGGMPPYGETTEYLTRIRRQFRRLPQPAVRPAPPETPAPAALAAPILD